MRTIPLLLAAAILGCGGAGTRFLEETQGAAPAFVSTSATMRGLLVAQQRAALLESAQLNAMFQLLREYVYPRDEGRVDLTNLYKVLHTVDQVGARARAGCAPIREQNVPAPFDVGQRATYACLGNDQDSPGYRNGYALRDDGTTTHALLAFRWAPDAAEQRSLGQVQGSFDTSSHELAFTLVNLVEYPAGSTMGGASGSGFTVRTDLSGNAAAHTFTLRALVGSVQGDTWTSLLGSGVSRGEGEHFLFRAFSASSTEPQGRYFCLPATIDEAGLGALDPRGDAVVPAACAHLTAAVEALTPLALDDAPLRASDFAGGDVGVSAEAP